RIAVHPPVRGISDGESTVIQLLKITVCGVTCVRRARSSLTTGSVAYAAWIEAASLVLLSYLLCGQRMHAHRDAMNFTELWTIFAETFRRKSLHLRFAVRDAISRIRVVAQKLRALTSLRLDFFEEPWKLDWVIACVIHHVRAEKICFFLGLA